MDVVFDINQKKKMSYYIKDVVFLTASIAVCVNRSVSALPSRKCSVHILLLKTAQALSGFMGTGE